MIACVWLFIFYQVLISSFHFEVWLRHYDYYHCILKEIYNFFSRTFESKMGIINETLCATKVTSFETYQWLIMSMKWKSSGKCNVQSSLKEKTSQRAKMIRFTPGVPFQSEPKNTPVLHTTCHCGVGICTPTRPFLFLVFLAFRARVWFLIESPVFCDQLRPYRMSLVCEGVYNSD